MQMTGLAPRARNPGKTPVPAAHTQDVLQQGNHLRWRVSRIVEAQHGLLCDACLPQSAAQEVSTEVLGRTHQQAHPLLLQHLQGSEASLKTAVREMQRSKHGLLPVGAALGSRSCGVAHRQWESVASDLQAGACRPVRAASGRCVQLAADRMLFMGCILYMQKGYSSQP